MPVQWKKTKYPGVRYYVHPTRKHGVQKDKYFAIRYQRNGKRKEEGLGWSSDGWSAEKASIEIAELKKAHTTGQGPTRLSEKRERAEKKKLAEGVQKKKDEQEAIIFSRYFNDIYLPIAKINKKPASYKAEEVYFNKWIKPIIGKMPFKKIRPFNIEKIKKDMLTKGKAPRTIEYVFAIVRQVWNTAKRDGIVDMDAPTKNVAKPKINNKRVRFLTHEEADVLLNELKSRSENVHNMALISLNCGLRASEIFRLTWGKIDLDRGIINVDGKGGRSRPAFMTERVKAMIKSLGSGKPNDLVFPDRNGNKISRISNAFQRSINKLNLNKNVTDRRQKVVFHTLRHTFASWLVEDGTDLYVVQKLLGHSSMDMTERYSHLSKDTLQAAVRNFEKSLSKSKRADIVSIENRNG